MGIINTINTMNTILFVLIDEKYVLHLRGETKNKQFSFNLIFKWLIFNNEVLSKKYL